MRKKPLVVAAAALTFFVAALAVFAAIPAKPGVTRSNFGRIQIGMLQADVDAVFNGPPGDIAPNGRKWTMLQEA